MSTVEVLRLNTRVCITNPVWSHIRKTSIAHLTTRYTFTNHDTRTVVAVATKSDDLDRPTIVTFTAAPADLSDTERDATIQFLTDDLASDPVSLGPVHITPPTQNPPIDGLPVVTSVALGG